MTPPRPGSLATAGHGGDGDRPPPLRCGACGEALAPGVVRCPRCGEPLVRPERKLVTLLFADLSGYTAFASALDPEDVFRAVRPWMTTLRLVVERHGGTVPQVMGDGFMAVFGVPTAHEDDAERAVLAALALVRQAGDLGQGPGALPFPGLHVGVNTGEVMVVGSRESSGFAVVGDAVNVTARLADLAASGEVLVGGPTRRLTRDRIRYAPRRALAAKGLIAPVEASRAVASRPGPSRRGAVGPGGLGQGSVRSGHGAFVDRSAVLHRLLAEADEARRLGRVRVRAIVDEPGVGKTRLAEELRLRLPGSLVLIGTCHPYGQRLPLTAIAEAVSVGIGVVPGSTPRRVRAAVHRFVAGRPEAAGTSGLETQVLTLLGLLPAPSHPGSGAATSPGGTPLDARAAVRPVLRALAGGRPIVLVLDDVHWADPDLVALLADLRRSPWPEPVLILALGRPEPEAWHRGLPRIRLGGLPPSEARRILAAALGGRIPTALADRLVERAGGNPLFLEESVRMLVERGALAGGPRGWRVVDPTAIEAVPASLRMLVAARLDALPADQKRVLQDASIAGEVTWEALILELAGLSDDGGDAHAVAIAIEQLRDRDLLRARDTSRVAGTIELESKHAVIRDVAYESLPLVDRALRHRRAAEWLEDRVGRAATAAIAHHYLRAWELGRSRAGTEADDELARRAAAGLCRWGDAVFAFQPRLAESLYGRGLGIAEEAPHAVEPEVVARLLVGRAEGLAELGRHREAIACAERARSLVSADDPGAIDALALLALGRARSDAGDVRAARALIETALERFRATGDTFGQARALHRLAEACRFDDFPAETAAYREAFRLYRAAGARAEAANVAEDLAYLLTVVGGRGSTRWFERARRLAERSGDDRSRAALARAWAYASLYRGDLDEALRAAREAREPAAAAGDRWLEVDTLLVEALVRSSVGPPAEAERLVRQLLRIADAAGARHLRALAQLAGARPALRSGRPRAASGRLADARRALVALGVAMELAEVDLTRAAVELDRGDWELAVRAADDGERRARAAGWDLLALLGPLIRGRAHLGAGHLAAARRDLRRAARMAAVTGADGPRILAEAALEEAELLAGRVTGGAGADEPAAAGATERLARLATLEATAIHFEALGLRQLPNDPAAAATALARAVRIWARLGRTAWLARAEGLRAVALESAGRGPAAAAARRRSDAVLAAIGAPPGALGALGVEVES